MHIRADLVHKFCSVLESTKRLIDVSCCFMECKGDPKIYEVVGEARRHWDGQAMGMLWLNLGWYIYGSGLK